MDFRAFNTKPPRSSKMGFRSSLVLAKLGFDLRNHYDDLLDEPLPEEISRLLQQLEERDVPRVSLR
jgi:Anti-sigma factor NepR